MIFKDKLNTLLTLMNITNAELAKAASIDSSLISRFRTGARVPSKNSDQIRKLSRGLAFLVKNQEQRIILFKASSLPLDINLDKLEDKMYMWLNGEDSELRPQRNYSEDMPVIKKKSPTLKFFKEKLDILMKVLNISNVQLAKALNVDSSLISRFRTGVRTPSAENEMINDICTYFSTRAKTQHQMPELIEVMELNLDPHLYKSKVLSELLYKWLLEDQNTKDNTAMDNFFQRLDMFQSTLKIPPCQIPVKPLQIAGSHEVNSYWGIDGIRQTVIDFLSAVASEDIPRTIYLYSDQNMQWLTSDKNFNNIWASLMLKVISKGNKICIIHTISRDLSEIFSAVQSWLPLYITGQIEPYYCRRPKDSIFSRTMFISPGLALVTSNCVIGTEDKAEYIYSKEANQIAYMMDQFKTMLSYSKRLMEIFTLETIDKFSLRLSEFEHQKGVSTALLSSLSIATMPRNLLIQILDRNNLPLNIKEKALACYDAKAKRFNKSISHNSYTELVFLPKNEQLLKYKEPIDLPIYITGEPLYYTSEEYSEHIKNIINILKHNNNYNIQLLPMLPFKHIKIIVKENAGTIIIKENNPLIIFTFNHPHMCSVFISYLNSLDDRCENEKKPKNIIIEVLLKYVI